jgi:C4-dicarboxylate transporter DctM subunit
MLITLCIALLITILFKVPLGICLGISSLLAVIVYGKVPALIIAQRMFTGIDIFTLLAIPLFIFAGKVMGKGGIAKKLTELSYATVGFLPGSLAIITVLSCMFFAALSGSSPATVAAIGGIMVPIMIKDGYPPEFAAALAAASGTIGVIIPPSIPFVNYAVLANVSVGDLFIAGVIPGILMGTALIIYCWIISKQRNYSKTIVKFTWKNFFKALKNSTLALLMPVIVLGGIYGGVFTPTEAAAVACVYSVLVSAFIYKELNLKEIPGLAYEAGVTTATIMLIIATATSFSWILATEQVPIKIANFISRFAKTPFTILLLINIILLINGCFMELTASLFILTPIFLPLISNAGINLIHFGVIAVVNMTLGLVTPPLGVNLFVANGLSKDMNFTDIVKHAVPMFIVLVVVLFAVTYIPGLSLGLLNFLKK